MLVFNEILEVFLATLFLHHWKCLRKLSHIDCWATSINRIWGYIGVRVDYRVVHDNHIISNYNSLPQDTVSANFNIIPNRHGLYNGPFLDVNVVPYILEEVPMLTGTYFSYLFCLLVGGLMITISERITYLPILTLAKSPLKINLWCKIAWSQISMLFELFIKHFFPIRFLDRVS